MGAELTLTGQERFRTIYEAYYWKVYAYCRRRTDPHSVDDAVAEAFLAAWRKIDDVPTDEAVLPWLYRAAYLSLTNRWRSSRRSKDLRSKLEGLRPEDGESPEEVIAMSDDVSDAIRAAGRLNASDQEVLKLALWEELPVKDIAFVLGLEPNAVYQRLHRAKKNLVKEYQRLSPSPRESILGEESGL